MLSTSIAPPATSRRSVEFAPPAPHLSGLSSISEHGVALAIPVNGHLTVLPDARTTPHAH